MTKKAVKTKTKTPKKKPVKKVAVKKKKSSLSSRIKSSNAQLQKAKQKTISEGEKYFKEAVKELFKEFKNLESFSWTQYTPHWNDGDVCEFGVHFDSLAINDEREGETEDLWQLERACKLLANKDKEEARIILELSDNKKENWEISQLKSDLEIIKKKKLEDVKEKYEIKKSIDILREIDESVYERMFGEGLVVVTRDGVTVGNYDHD